MSSQPTRRLLQISRSPTAIHFSSIRSARIASPMLQSAVHLLRQQQLRHRPLSQRRHQHRRARISATQPRPVRLSQIE